MTSGAKQAPQSRTTTPTKSDNDWFDRSSRLMPMPKIM